MKKLIMSDLDNTLVPIITQEDFARMWFTDVARLFGARGMDPAAAMSAMEGGCRAMIFNDGTKINLDAFYDAASERTGLTRAELEPIINEYYDASFSNVRSLARENPYAPEIARLMREKSQYAVIATMPIFPLSACDMRMSWVGLSAGMFDGVTTCENSRCCKPNPLYYAAIMEQYGVTADETLMIGNDVREDMAPCESLGIDVFLVTDHIITHGMDYDRFRQGSYPELIAYLRSL